MSNWNVCAKCQQNVIDTEYLKCKRCEKSIHKVCLSFGTPGDLHGDVFFDMICSQCNFPSGRETFSRKKLPWIMVVILVIYNLSIKSPGLGNHGYYHYKIHISNFVFKYWTHLFAPEFKRKKNWIGSIAGTLSHFNRVYFMSGSEELGSNGWWKLVRNETPLSYFNQYEESQKLRQSFMRRAASTSNSAVAPQEPLQIQSELLECVKREEDSEEEVEPIPLKKIKVEEISIEGLLESFSANISTEDIPDMTFKGEEFVFSWDDMSQNIKEDSNFGEEEEEDSGKSEIFEGETIKEEDQSSEESDNEILTKDDKYPYTAPKSLFRTSARSKASVPEEDSCSSLKQNTEMMSEYEEGELLKKLKDIVTKKPSEEIPQDIRRFYRKLTVREAKRKLLKPLHNIDILPHANKTKKPEMILDRFHQLTCTAMNSDENEDVKFSARLVGNVQQELYQSPYSGRILQPYIYRDSVSMPQWVKMMCEVQFTVNCGEIPSRGPIDYCYVRPHHIPAVNSLLQRLFWPGIDMSECLMYPDFSVVALYKRLIIGCAFLVPDVGHNEAYISFMGVRPGWQKAGIGSFMLYHLTQTCSEKDITLHVSATNSAVFLYQKFGFKIEEMILDFYDKYLPWESTESRHAFFLRLKR